MASRDQASANVSGESVILGMKDSTYYGLGTVGTRIWEMLQAPVVLGDVVTVMTSEFDVSQEAAAADLLAFVAELDERGLVEVVDP